MERLPWLEYTGQTTSELIACNHTHRLDSLLCAFEEGIQAKLGPRGDGSITAEELLVLAVMALDREVHNGGYHQFFVNASRRFVPMIVDSLRRIGCDAAAGVTERAIAALQLPSVSTGAVTAAILGEDAARDQALDACDDEFYRLDEIGPKLFRFIEAHQARIQLVKPAHSVQPRPKTALSAAATLYIHLLVTRKTGLNLDGIRQLARQLAAQNSITTTETDIEGAAVLYAFHGALHADDLAACELLAPRALELMREDTAHCILHRRWVEKLIAAARLDLADASALAYLEYLAVCDPSALSTQNRVLFWAALLQENRAVLPGSVEFFRANFPDENLDGPLPLQRFVPRPPGKK